MRFIELLKAFMTLHFNAQTPQEFSEKIDRLK